MGLKMSATPPSPAEITALIDAKSELRLRVIPGARVEKAAIENGALKLWLRVPPEGGKANAAVITKLADMLGVPQSAIEIVQGQASRDKRVRVEGLFPFFLTSSS